MGNGEGEMGVQQQAREAQRSQRPENREGGAETRMHSHEVALVLANNRRAAEERRVKHATDHRRVRLRKRP